MRLFGSGLQKVSPLFKNGTGFHLPELTGSCRHATLSRLTEHAMTEVQPDQPLSHPFRVATLPTRKPMRFALSPDAATRKAIATSLGLLDLPAFRFAGELRPSGRHDFVLEADLEARIVQPCSVSLAPVPGTISEKVTRRYVADYELPEGDEVEMPEDDTTDPLPEVIDVGFVALEALALALPLYPRAPGVELGEAIFAAPGTAPITDADLKPFAGLAALKDRLTPPKDGE
jgi:uncharacterized metal-binding protein YceD (DUF177 family)